MCWIDYHEVYNMVPYYSWIMECLTMFKIANNVQNLLQYAMPLWKVELTLNNQNSGNIEIKQGIFQGDSQSPLLFIICLIPLTLIQIAKNGLTTYCIWTTWNYMVKQTNVLIYKYRLLEYSIKLKNARYLSQIEVSKMKTVILSHQTTLKHPH